MLADFQQAVSGQQRGRAVEGSTEPWEVDNSGLENIKFGVEPEPMN